jgi:hypothetical protein
MKQPRTLALLLACSVCAVTQSVSAGDLQLTETEDQIRVTLRGKPVLEYVKTERPVPEGIEPHFRRSGYIHPVYTPAGQEISGDFPADHAHQHALFFAWTKAGFDGKNVDFWNQAKDLGKIEFREVVELKREERQTCGQCGFPLPVYPGRYPKKCPNCDAPYDMPAPGESRRSITRRP